MFGEILLSVCWTTPLRTLIYMFMGLGLFCCGCPKMELRLTPGGNSPGGRSPGGSSPGGSPKFIKGGGGFVGLFLS